jgi:hypothetical protein
MRHLLNQLWPLRGGHNGRVVAGVFVSYLMLTTAWWHLGLPAGFEQLGVVLLDERPGWDRVDVVALFEVLGPNGQASYRLFSWIDGLLSIAFAAALGPLLAWPLERIRPGQIWPRLPALLPWAAAALDLAENAAVLVLLASWPAFPATLPLWGGTLTLVKMAVLAVIPLALVLSWVGYGGVTLARRGA